MTPAVKMLKKFKIDFVVHEYEHDANSRSFGMEAAEKLGLDPARVYKTLIVSSDTDQLFVAMVPVSKQLHLKKLASALKVKKVTMADPKRVERVSGYVVGGVSPLGQKKRLKTVLDSGANELETIFVSGGKRGLDIELKPRVLADVLDVTCADISTP